jgi:hypothetical protein
MGDWLALILHPVTVFTFLLDMGRDIVERVGMSNICHSIGLTVAVSKMIHQSPKLPHELDSLLCHFINSHHYHHHHTIQ